MSLQRSLFPITRSSLLVVPRGGTVARRLLTTRTARENRSGIGLAVTATLGLSLVSYYALTVGPLHADRRLDHDELETGVRDSYINDDIRALRARKSVDSFSSERKDIERLLKRYEESYSGPSASGVARYDISQVASNDPLEDDHSEAFVSSSDSYWSIFAVLDGHSGWETSALLRKELIGTVIEELAATAPKSTDSSNSDPFADAITRAFKRLDDKIVHQNVEQALQSKSRSVAVNLLAPAYAGACALLSLYDAKSSKLRVALTGDCRAVLGRKRPDGKFDLEVLTADQTGFNADEKKRVEAEHPGETVVKDGRTMGFGPSRVFGDARWKWSREIQDKLKKNYLGRTVLDSIKTPPYFTAEPVITTTTVQPGDFIVLATDGLWECLTNQEVVGLVGDWIQQHEGHRMSWRNWWRGLGVMAKNDLPVVSKGETKGETRSDNDFDRYRQWSAEKRFVTVDANAATHLIRNSLGGADEDLREALLSMRSPRARSYWDDITATVVFFGRRD